MKNVLSTLLAGLMALGFVLAPAPASAQATTPIDSIVAVVDEEVIPRIEELDERRRRCHPGSECKPADSTLELCQTRFKGEACRVSRAAIVKRALFANGLECIGG